MSASSRRHARTAVMVVILLAVAAWWMPSLLSAEHYRRALVAHLGQMLGRRVDFRSASFNLVPRPGFSLHNVVVEEDPQFGTEPFARIDDVECDLRLRSLWRGHLDFVQLRLDGATLNIVRNARGEWNVENLLRGRGVASPRSVRGRIPSSLDLDADHARLNFKIGPNKKPFAITDLNARLTFDPAARAVRFHLTGSPIRTDSPLPTPGALNFSGEWKPGGDLAGGLNAMLETRGAMLYDWVPLVTGRDLGIYGVLDASIHLSGALPALHFQGQGRLEQLHRWESLPPSGSLPIEFRFRGQFDRTQARAVIDALDASFANSRIHVTGTVAQIPASPQLDLVVALDRSRLEDLFALGRRLRGAPAGRLSLAGRVDALVTMQGPWNALDYGGSVIAREATLSTPTGVYPLSAINLKLGGRGVRLEPLRISVAPKVEITAEGSIGSAASLTARRGFSLLVPAARSAEYRARLQRFPDHPPEVPASAGLDRYELSLMASSVPVGDLINFARSLGAPAVPNLNAQGLASADFRLRGSVRPFTSPVVSGHADLFRTRLYVPGVTEPVNLSRAHLQVNGKRVTVGPLTARVGTSTFVGRLQHDGERKQPWQFEIRADELNLNQDALWFDALGYGSSLRLLAFFPGLRSLAARLAAGSSLLGAINAQGQFFTPDLSYGAINLRNFQATVGVSRRVVRVSDAVFRAAGGRGQGDAEINLSSNPPRVKVDLALDGAKVQTWALDAPSQLRKVRGLLSGSVAIETQGLSHEALASNLQGTAQAYLRNVDMGGFDPLGAAAHVCSFGKLDPARGSVTLPSLAATFSIRNRRVALASRAIRIAGGLFDVAGTYDFDGALVLNIRADLRHTSRRWLDSGDEDDPIDCVANFRLAGHLGELALVPATQPTQARR